jgi:probable rRNA maturation factor
MKVLVRSRIRKRRINRSAVARFATFVMRRAGIPAGAELSVLFVGSTAMRSLNRRYLRRDRDTDVMAFPLGSGGRGIRGACPLGDVVVSLDRAARQARRIGTGLNAELLLCLVHGILHLRGFDDCTAAGRRAMEQRQEAIVHEALKVGPWNVIS